MVRHALIPCTLVCWCAYQRFLTPPPPPPVIFRYTNLCYSLFCMEMQLSAKRQEGSGRYKNNGKWEMVTSPC